MAPRTAWTRGTGSSSFPSDRIPPRTDLSKPGPKPKTNNPSPPKSDEVKKLESLHSALQRPPKNPDPNKSCFCQARRHPLSPYTPICKSCGLILCGLNLPQHTCPHCSAHLLTPTARTALTTHLASQIASTLTKEASERERIAENARRAAGAFPALRAADPSRASPSPPPPPPPSDNPNRDHRDRPHKVMSLTGKKDKVVMSSYYTTTPTTTPPRSGSRTPDVPDHPPRVLPPPQEISHSKTPLDPSRPWANSKRTILYVPPSTLVD